MAKFHSIKEGLTFDDVLLVPKRSTVKSRRDIDLSSRISRTISLRIPIISSSMNTVTESRMAIAMARAGGIGVIHRFLSISKQADKVKKVKRAQNFIIEDPFTLSPKETLRDYKEAEDKYGVHSFLIVDDKKRLLGIVARRDVKWERNLSVRLENLMTPRNKLITSLPSVNLESIQKIFKKYKIEKLPIINDQNVLVGLITSRDIQNKLNSNAACDSRGRLLVGAAVGAKDDFIERAQELIQAGADLIVVDIAHGHLEICLKAVKALKHKFPDIDLMVGNIATYEGAKDLIKAGADSVKVGIGPGSVCKTRIISGAGMPQLTAIMEARRGASDVPIIADGGMKTSGDIVKALAAGASAVMSGWFFVGTDEAPGEVIYWNNQRVKLYKGMASLAAKLDRNEIINIEEVSAKKELTDFIPEGVDEASVPYRGKVSEVLAQLVGGIRSGMSYCGAHTIHELWQKAEFIKITEAARREGEVHDVNI